MKKILLIAAAVVFMGVCIVVAAENAPGAGIHGKAQPGQGFQKKHGEMGMEMYSQLNLTDDQKAKIKEILESRRSQLSALKEDTSLNPEQKREKMKTIMETTDEQINQVLTPEQQQKYKEMKEKMRERMKERWQKQNQQGNPQAQETK